MRQISHDAVPDPLDNPSAEEARDRIRDFLQQGDALRSARRAPLDTSIYERSGVREALHKLFYEKCGYCESGRTGPLDTDHYRPISAARMGRKDYPHHYSWLAFDWRNLILACQACSKRKGNLFPQYGRIAQLLAPLAEVRAVERPHLLDPGLDQPYVHLDFTLDGHCHGRTNPGVATITLLELDRPELIEERRSIFQAFVSRMTEDTPGAITELDDDTIPFVGAMRILRFRFLSTLARRVGHFNFGFDDAVPLAPRILERATREAVEQALDTLNRPGPRGRIATKGLIGPRPFTPAIRRIEISNFKGIEHLALEMNPSGRTSSEAGALMLLGENATGKSSVLEAVTLALSGAETANALAKAKYFEPQPWPGRRRLEERPHIAVHFVEGPPAELWIENGNFVGKSEPRANVIAYGSSRFFKRGMRHRRRPGGAWGLFDPTWTLPNPEKWLKGISPGRFPEIARALGEMLALPDKSYVAKRNGHLVIDDTVREIETPLAQHSDGFRSIFATGIDMLSWLTEEGDIIGAQGVVLIDEIETHLHPRWKMRLMSAMRKALPNVQFIVTTHDPLCLRSMGRGEVQVMARDADNRIQLVPDLPDPSSLRIDQILTSEHFGMRSTLDPEFERMFDDYYRLLRESQDNPAVKPQLDRMRDTINARQKVGQTERERLLLEAIDRHIARRVLSRPERKSQDEALVAELDAIWGEARAASA